MGKSVRLLFPDVEVRGVTSRVRASVSPNVVKKNEQVDDRRQQGRGMESKENLRRGRRGGSEVATFHAIGKGVTYS